MSLEHREKLVDDIVETQPELGAFMRSRPSEHDLMFGSWDLQSYSFQQGFEALWDHARFDHSGLLLQPLLLLWRQSIELAFKAAIVAISGEISGNPSHKLDELFAQLLIGLTRHCIEVDDDLTSNVRTMISHVQSLDPFADRFRYPSRKSGEPFEGIDVDLDVLFQAHWIIVTYCEGVTMEVEEGKSL